MLTAHTDPGGAGLRTVHTEAHDRALTRMIDRIDARPAVLRRTAPDRLHAAGVDVDAVLRYTALAKESIADGILGLRAHRRRVAMRIETLSVPDCPNLAPARALLRSDASCRIDVPPKTASSPHGHS